MYRTARQYEPMSFEKIRNELLQAQASILVDTATNRKYILPSKTTRVQKKLYHILGLKRSEVPRPMTQVLPGKEKVAPSEHPTY